MGSIEKFSTSGVTPPQRLDFWNRLCEETLARTCVDSPSRSFRAEMWRWSLGELTMIRPRSEASVVTRSPVRSIPRERLIVLHFQHHGHSRHLQGRREVELSPGSFTLSAAEDGYTFDLGTEHELLVIEMPRAPLEARLPSLDDHLCKRFWGGLPSGRVFHDFLLSIWRQGDQSGTDPQWQRGISNVFFDLVALAINGSGNPVDPNDGGNKWLKKRLLEFIEMRLCDPELRTATLAGEMGVSLRTIQNVFASMSITPSGYILERRLQRGADLLRTDRARSVTGIAFDLGFNDSAYFTRCFRQHFGMTPTEWRSRH